MVDTPPPLPCVPPGPPARRRRRDPGRPLGEEKTMRYSKSVLTFEGKMGSHPSEDDLEEFVFGRLDGLDLELLEEHLLACEGCRKRLTETENFVASTRAAARKMLGAPPPAPKPRRFSAPALAMAGAFAVMLVGVGYTVVPLGRSPQTVDLVAERGPALGQASPGRPLDLRLDVTGLAPARWVEIVNAEGAVLHAANVRAVTNPLLHQAPALPPGQSWVRLYAQPSPPAGTAPLREFSLRVQ